MVSGLKVANGVQGYRVLVQSTKLSTFVEKRVEAFLVKAQVGVTEMSQCTFNSPYSDWKVNNMIGNYRKY